MAMSMVAQLAKKGRSDKYVSEDVCWQVCSRNLV
jgi:hypothetical protein